MRILACSDLHRDLEAARSIVERSAGFDVVVVAGDLADQHHGLEEVVDVLAGIRTPTVLVPGNNETDAALGEACSEWSAASVLHGECAEVAGVEFFGLGAGVPTTPWDWSFDLSDEEAAAALEPCPAEAVLISHSPPQGHCDSSSGGDHLGSHAILDAIATKQPPLVVCGHIHEAWGERSRVGPTEIANLGPGGAEFEL